MGRTRIPRPVARVKISSVRRGLRCCSASPTPTTGSDTPAKPVMKNVVGAPARSFGLDYGQAAANDRAGPGPPVSVVAAVSMVARMTSALAADPRDEFRDPSRDRRTAVSMTLRPCGSASGLTRVARC